jgi:uncharacterized membrane protein
MKPVLLDEPINAAADAKDNRRAVVVVVVAAVVVAIASAALMATQTQSPAHSTPTPGHTIQLVLPNANSGE